MINGKWRSCHLEFFAVIYSAILSCYNTLVSILGTLFTVSLLFPHLIHNRILVSGAEFLYTLIVRITCVCATIDIHLCYGATWHGPSDCGD